MKPARFIGGLPALVFKPIDMSRDIDITLKFVAEARFCSFGYWPDKQQLNDFAECVRLAQSKNPWSEVHAWHDGIIVGYLELVRSTAHQNWGYVGLVHLASNLRGKGYSTQLHDYMLQYFKGQGNSAALVSVSRNNLKAMGWYMKNGWTQFDKREDIPELLVLKHDFDVDKNRKAGTK